MKLVKMSLCLLVMYFGLSTFSTNVLAIDGMINFRPFLDV